jgi:hypothetical protein
VNSLLITLESGPPTATAPGGIISGARTPNVLAAALSLLPTDIEDSSLDRLPFGGAFLSASASAPEATGAYLKLPSAISVFFPYSSCAVGFLSSSKRFMAFSTLQLLSFKTLAESSGETLHVDATMATISSSSISISLEAFVALLLASSAIQETSRGTVFLGRFDLLLDIVFDDTSRGTILLRSP